MIKSTVILIILSLFLGTGVWLVFIWTVKKGGFDDIEGPKHRMLDDDEITGFTRKGERDASENHEKDA